jgi:hypothetical protein
MRADQIAESLWRVYKPKRLRHSTVWMLHAEIHCIARDDYRVSKARYQRTYMTGYPRLTAVKGSWTSLDEALEALS